jgi:hypothetical protein
MKEMFPRARREDLLVEEVLNEVMIYDMRSQQVHYLRETAVAIWDACDGKTSVHSLSEKASCEESVVWEVLEQLQRRNLLENIPSFSSELVSRREMIKKLGIGAAAATPLIMTIVAPMPAMAQSLGVQGPQGPQGVQGPQGPQGPQGVQGP